MTRPFQSTEAMIARCCCVDLHLPDDSVNHDAKSLIWIYNINISLDILLFRFIFIVLNICMNHQYV